MTVRYDREVDVLRILFNDHQIAESDEVAPGIVLDYDAVGRVVGIEVLDASEQVSDPGSIRLQTAAA
ncbi:MAG: DUF2283 domain-containing protein [Fimbriimonadaceae bacterium]|nr:DUF2283 domain-containing protein [Fimbriimonadaceae bacterium]